MFFAVCFVKRMVPELLTEGRLILRATRWARKIKSMGNKRVLLSGGVGFCRLIPRLP